MPIDYKKYPDNWKTEIRPSVLDRDNHCCKFCKVPNYEYVFRGLMNGKEIFQTSDGSIYSYPGGEFIAKNVHAEIEPITGDINQKAIKIILTIAHLDHDEENKDVQIDRLAALCQKCHLVYDAPEKKRRRRIKRKNAQKSKYDGSFFPIK